MGGGGCGIPEKSGLNVTPSTFLEVFVLFVTKSGFWPTNLNFLAFGRFGGASHQRTQEFLTPPPWLRIRVIEFMVCD